MANYKNIAGHTIYISLLRKGNVIDLGCRDFAFAQRLKGLGCKVFCFDADPEVKSNEFTVINKAVTTFNGTINYAPLGECGFTDNVKETNGQIPVECVDFNELAKTPYDVLKIDIEGGEYNILSDIRFKPLPKQITVEFHRHVFPELHDEIYPKVIANLSKWYDLVYQRQDAPLMDCLFIRR